MKEGWLLDDTFRQEYLDFCKLAATNDTVFDTFRKNDRIKTIIENSTDEQGKRTIDELIGVAPLFDAVIDDMNKFATSEYYGSPDLMDGAYRVSSTTVRYAYILHVFFDLFSEINEKENDISIVEIGGGYGGQCKVFHDYYHHIDKYTIYDLPEVCMLQKKFLSKFEIYPKFHSEIKDASPHDYLISWCGWGELSYEMKKEYAEKVISKSNAYLICSNYNLGEDVKILESIDMAPELYGDQIVENVLYYKR